MSKLYLKCILATTTISLKSLYPSTAYKSNTSLTVGAYPANAKYVDITVSISPNISYLSIGSAIISINQIPIGTNILCIVPDIGTSYPLYYGTTTDNWSKLNKLLIVYSGGNMIIGGASVTSGTTLGSSQFIGEPCSIYPYTTGKITFDFYI